MEQSWVPKDKILNKEQLDTWLKEYKPSIGPWPQRTNAQLEAQRLPQVIAKLTEISEVSDRRFNHKINIVPILPRSLDTNTALSLLPAIDHQSLTHHTTPSPPDCTCRLTDTPHPTPPHNRSDFTHFHDDNDPHQQSPEPLPQFHWHTDDHCLAAAFLRSKYRLCEADEAAVAALHERYLPGVNCSTTHVLRAVGGGERSDSVVPDVFRDLRRKLEAYKPYSISETVSGGVVQVQVDDKERTTGDGELGEGGEVECREFHETVDVPSYNGETLRILPYVIID